MEVLEINMGLDIYFNKVKEIGYFRKVNFLVAYFENRGYKIDSCKEVTIDISDVTELLNRCNEVLKNNSKASELLPTQSGFFFGNTNYNECYFEDVKCVKEYIENALLKEFNNLKDNESITFSISY